MNSKDRSSISFLSAVQFSAAIAVLMTGIFAFTAGTALKNLNQGTAVEVNAQDFTWWKNTHFAFEKVIATTPLVFPVEPALVASAPAVKLVRVNQTRHHISRKPAVLAAVHIEIEKLFVGPMQPVEQHLDEKLVMRSLHSILRTRFQVAMNSQVPLDIQTAALALTQEPKVEVATKKPPPHIAKRIVLSPVLALQAPVVPVRIISPKPAVMTVIRTVANATAPLAVSPPLLKEGDSDSIRITRAEAVQAMPQMETGMAEAMKEQPPIPTEHGQLPSAMAMTAAPESTPLSADDVNTQITTQIQKYNAIGALATQPESPAGYSAVTTQTAPSILPPKLVGDNAIEAFTSDQVLLQAMKSLLSAEGQSSGSQGKWWEYTEKQNHWSTLVSIRAAESESLQPMISNNTAMTLATAAHVELQADTGIIFGKIPAGWEIDLSGRSERPVFFDEDFKSITAAITDKTRNFALINVAPGVPLLYVTAVGGSKSAAIALPVKPGTATYINIPVPTHQTMSGRVFDASSSAPHGLSGISVSVVGQDGLTAITNDKGFFKVQDVLVFGEQSLYLDVKPDDKSFVHRYRVSSSTLKNLSLFYFNETTIDFLLKQLDGGVSPAGGLVIGAFPETVAKIGSQVLYPNISPMLKNQSLTSEAYTLSETNRLLPRTALTSSSPRFLDLQVPEGANIASLNSDPSNTSNGDSAWSEIVISQQGVICVVGPY